MKKFRLFSIAIILGILVIPHLTRPTFVYAAGDSGLDPGGGFGTGAGPIIGTPSKSLPEDIGASQRNMDEGRGVDANSTASVFMHGSAGTFVNMVIDTSAKDPSLVKGPDRTFVGFFSNSLTAMISRPPASSIEYIAYLQDKINLPNIVQPAYAASKTTGGIGFDRLSPILPIWELSRGIAYFCLSIVFVVIAFMIMFRVKIDPKTVASVQNSLPKIFLAVILIYFSYAIAGFLIDLMYVLIGIIMQFSGRLSASYPEAKGTIADMQTKLSGETIFNVFGWNLFNHTATSTAAAFNEIVQNMIEGASGSKGDGTRAFGFLTSMIAYVIIAGALLWALLKTWVALLSAYVQIILGVISAPVMLMFEAIPGQNAFMNWLKNMLVNILVFPFTILMIMLGLLLSSGWSTTDGFVPPLIGGNSIGAIQSLIGLGVILSMPKGIDMLKEFLKAPSFKYGNAWAESMQGAIGMERAGIKKGYDMTGIPQARSLVNQAQASEKAQSILTSRGILNRLVVGFGKQPSSQTIKDITRASSHPGG